MKGMKWVMLGVLLCGSLGAQSTDSAPINELMPGLGNLYHPVSTDNPEAQRFFDQGLTLVYAFNHDAAYQSFKKAAELDPNLAMAYWGMALSLGQNINMEVTPENEKHAYELIQKALTLAPKATENEQAYVEALASRYTDADQPDLPKLRVAYNQAMKEVAEKYPEDLDAVTLYGESSMNLHPWGLWTTGGAPLEGTMEIVNLLEGVIKRDNSHLGANHFYIHAVEASAHPEWGLMSAERMQTMLPASGHFLHMPSHIYIRLGDYAKAAQMNREAIVADKEYIEQYGLSGIYPVHYMTHNYFFLCRSYMLLGDWKDAKATANELYAFYVPHYEHMPELEYYALAPIQVALRFQKWQEVIDLPLPDPKMAIATVYWHFARAMAYLSLDNKEQATAEQKLFLAGKAKIPKTAPLGYNLAQNILSIAETLIEAKRAWIDHKPLEAIRLQEVAIAKEDMLNYNEPPDWYYSNREVLGAYYFFQKEYKKAQETFTKDLQLHPRNGRSLYGLWQTYEQEQEPTNAFWVKREFDLAWKYADSPLTMDNLLD